jgi:hypothetical protein
VVGTDGSGGWKDRSHVIYSDNGGKTWGIGGTSDFGTNEATVVQLGNGSLYLNSRNMQSKKVRTVLLSKKKIKKKSSVSLLQQKKTVLLFKIIFCRSSCDS